VRVKAGRGIANAKPEPDGWYQRVVETKVYQVRDIEDDYSPSGTWTTVRTIDHPGDPVVFDPSEVEFTDETESDPIPEYPLTVSELLEDDSSYITTGKVSLSEIRAFAESSMHEDWVPVLTGREVAPGVVGVSGVFVTVGEGRVEIMIGQYSVQIGAGQFPPNSVPGGATLDVGVTLFGVVDDEGFEDYATHTATWNTDGFYSNDPESPQGEGGWFDLDTGGDNDFFDVDVYPISVNAFPINY